jgi:hypothetical protein
MNGFQAGFTCSEVVGNDQASRIAAQGAHLILVIRPSDNPLPARRGDLRGCFQSSSGTMIVMTGSAV